MRSIVSSLLLLSVLGSTARSTPIRVIIMAGQSNMVGGGAMEDLPKVPVDLSEPQDDVRYHYWINANETGVSTEWRSLKPLKKEIIGTTYGPELTFGRTVSDRLENEEIAIIKFAANGTNLEHDWNPHSDTGLLYDHLVSHVQTALGQLEEAGHSPTIDGFVWVHGTGDAQSNRRALAYEVNLRGFISSLREDLNASDLPVILSQMHSDALGGLASVDVLRESQRRVTESDPLIKMVNIDDLPLKDDRIHFMGVTQLELGNRLGRAFTENLFPWHNEDFPTDVDGDNETLPVDALVVINEINNPVISEPDFPNKGALLLPPLPDQSPPPYLDVSGDNAVTPLDALIVINWINARNQNGQLAVAQALGIGALEAGILGLGVVGSQSLSSVPEPSTAALALVGLWVIAHFYGRRPQPIV